MRKNKNGLKIIALLLPIIIYGLSNITKVNFDALFVVGVFLYGIILWVKVGIDWPSLYVIMMLMLVPKLSIQSVFSSSFGHPTFIFLMFTFALTHALSQTPFIKRVAIYFVNLPFAKKSIKHLIISFLGATLLMGLIMSPTVLFFILYPVLQEIFVTLKIKKGDNIAKLMLMGLVMTVSLSSGMTPIAHVFPLLSLNVFTSITSIEISYVSYMAFAIPFGLIIFASLLTLLFIAYRHDLDSKKLLENIDIEITKIRHQEIITVAVFMFVVLLWIIPDILGYKSINIAFPPMIGVLLLALIQVDEKPLLNLNESFTKGMNWPSLLMTAAALALGSALTNPDIGIITYITQHTSSYIENMPGILLILIFIVWASLQSNISSHMVTSQLVSSIAVPIFISVESLSASAIAALIGMLASLGCATPPSMPYVAVATSSGYVSPKDMMSVGFKLMGIIIILSLLIGYNLANYFIGG